jgi:hypothetical protein
MYTVLEIQKAPGGAYASLVYHFDKLQEAESKYYDVLHYAAMSGETLEVHGAFLFDIWNVLEHKVYDRRTLAVN